MDPSASICLSYDSLKETPPEITESIEWYDQQRQMPLTPSHKYVSVQSAVAPQYCDPARYEILQKIKDAFNVDGFVQARDAMNPFEQIGRSIFINRAAVKLANIDAVNHVTNDIFTFDAKISDRAFKFCDVAAGPGGFTQYMQYRFPNSTGYGMTLRSETLDWSTNFLDMKRFTPFYGPDNTGSLYTNHEAFVQYVLNQEPEGVDLVTGDGGFDLDDTMDRTLLHRQEFLSSRLLLTQALVGIGCAKVGGNFVVKVFDTVTDISAHILFVLAQCFQKIAIFKPVTSRPANAERYVICMDRKQNVTSYYQLLLGAAKTYTDTSYLLSLFDEPLAYEFKQWLIQNNSRSIDLQLQAAQNILLYLQGKNPDIPIYNIHKFLTIWNLPDTPIHPRKSLITIL
jgi:cap1 methyltransferase